jgi:SSS family solute:Na+ symporter
MSYLSPFDYLIIAAYFVALAIVAVWAHRMASRNLDSYFLADKRLPWWMLGVSGMGYSLDVSGTMLIVSLIYVLGMRGLYIEFRGGVSLALICQMLWTGKWHRRSGCITVAEWMSFRFGDCRAAEMARLVTAISFIVFAISMLSYLVVGTGLFFSQFLPFTPLTCSLILLIATTVFTAASGFYGVVIADLLQCGLIVLSIVIVIALAVQQIGDGSDFAVLAESVTGMRNWTLSFPNLFESDLPVDYAQYRGLLTYTFFFLVLNKLFINGFGSGYETQFFAARSDRECGLLAGLWSALMTLRWPMMMAYVVLGIFLVRDFFPDQRAVGEAAAAIQESRPSSESQWREVISQIKNHPELHAPELIAMLEELLGTNWKDKIELIGIRGTINAERILPSVLLYRIPSGFRGLIMIALIAALMSTFDMTMNKTAAMFTNDIYRRFIRPFASMRELLVATYVFCGALVAVAFVMAYRVPNINMIWGWIAMGLWSGIGMPMLLRLYWWRFNAMGFVVGTLGGLAAALAVLFLDTYGDVHFSEVAQFLMLTPISLLCSIVGTFLAPPTEKAVIDNFYRTTRPFGFWKPLEAVLTDGDLQMMKQEHRHDFCALPFAFVWMVSMYLLPMQLLIQRWQAAAVTGAVFLVSTWGLYRIWYCNLPPSDETLSV